MDIFLIDHVDYKINYLLILKIQFCDDIVL